MQKKDMQTAQRKLDKKHRAARSYWDRVTTDPDFIRAKLAIRQKYELPLRTDGQAQIRRAKLAIRQKYELPLRTDGQAQIREWFQWLGLDEGPGTRIFLRRVGFFAEVNALFEELQIPPEWHDLFLCEITGQGQYRRQPTGLPKLTGWRDADGVLRSHVVIEADTDITNPIIFWMIRDLQKKIAGRPPKPARDKTNRRKNDWRPVREWYLQHPYFTIPEIAKSLGYSAQYVREQFAEIDPSGTTYK